MSTHQKKHIKQSGNRTLLYCDKSGGEVYGRIDKVYGNCMFDIKILDTNEICKATIRGKFKKNYNKVKFMDKDYVIAQSPECDTNTKIYYLIHKFSREDVLQLKKSGEIIEKEENSEIQFENNAIQIINKPGQEINDEFLSNI